MERIIALLAIGSIFIGCSDEPKVKDTEEAAAEEAVADKRFASRVDKEYGFIMDYPIEWDTNHTEPGIVFLAKESTTDTADKFSENFTVFVMAAEGQTMDEIADQNIKAASKYYSLEDIKSSKAVNKNGVSYIRVSLPIETQGLKLAHYTTFFMNEDRIYTLSQMTEESKTAQYDSLFMHMLNSFRWTPMAH